jgi:hypothetical protein
MYARLVVARCWLLGRFHTKCAWQKPLGLCCYVALLLCLVPSFALQSEQSSAEVERRELERTRLMMTKSMEKELAEVKKEAERQKLEAATLERERNSLLDRVRRGWRALLGPLRPPHAPPAPPRPRFVR